LAGVHDIAMVHATQALAALHTMFVPHEAPAVLLVALSTQTEEPVPQDVVPTLQGLGLVVHPMRPGVQDVQIPALQKRLFMVPQEVPSGSDVVRSVHMAAPVAQDSIPLWHALAGVQVPPLLQVAQVPALQTIPVPQVVPAPLFPLSPQTARPVAQEIVPVLHTLVG
jgi:hypothetical protein